MATEPTTSTGQREAYAHLERAYIGEYLAGQGLSTEALRTMPAEQARALLRAASLYASGKLVEAEARAHLIEELHGRARPL